MARITLILVCLILPGCFGGSSKSSPDKASEIPDKQSVQTDLSAPELLEKSKTLYANSLYTTAAESFQTLRDAYSPGPYAEFAQIKLADSNFELSKFDTAAAAYEEFLKTHPSSKAVAYALLRAGRSHELSNKGVGRDISPLEKARSHYEKLIEQYPQSVYAGAARAYYKEVAKKIKQHNDFVKDFYRRREKDQAVQAREEHYASAIKPILERAGAQADRGEEAGADEEIEGKDGRDEDSALSESLDTPKVLGVERKSSVSVKRKAPEAPLVDSAG